MYFLKICANLKCTCEKWLYRLISEDCICAEDAMIPYQYTIPAKEQMSGV